MALGLLTAARGAAQATAAPTDSDRARARSAYERGRAHFRAGEFEAAETAFEEAYSVIPNAVVLLSVAEARERGGDIAGAVAAFEQYLRERLDAPDGARVRSRVTELRARPATLRVTSTPAGASIRIDGQVRGESTPAELQLPPGSHRVEVSLAGHQSASTTVEVALGGQQGADLVLRPTPALASSAPSGPSSPSFTALTSVPPDAAQASAGLGAGFWVAVGVAGGGAIAGGVLGLMVLSKHSDYEDNPSADTADAGERLGLFADVGFGVAAAAAVTAVVLYATSGDEEDAEAESGAAVGRVRGRSAFRATPVLAPGVVGLSGTASF